MAIGPLEPEILFSHFVQSFASQPLDLFFTLISYFGHPVLWMILASVYWWKGDEKKSMAVAGAVLFASALVGLAKPFAGRLRPSIEEFRVVAADIESNFSLPSGHATVSAGMLGYLWARLSKNLKAIGIAIVALVMLSRVYLGVHFIGDVILGAFLGFVIGKVMHYIEEHYKAIRFDRKKILEEVGLVIFTIAALIISLLFRSIGLASVLLGFFAGAMAFKLANLDTKKVSGQELIVKSGAGFAVFAGIIMAGDLTLLQPEAYFVAGLWLTAIYPAIYEKYVAKWENEMPQQAQASEAAASQLNARRETAIGAKPKKLARKKKSGRQKRKK